MNFDAYLIIASFFIFASCAAWLATEVSHALSKNSLKVSTVTPIF